MSTINDPPTPQDAKAWLYDRALRLYSILPRSLRSFLKLLLFQVSPEVPVDLTTAWRDVRLNAVFAVATSLTFLMCFVVIFVWSAASGTLWGSDPSRLYFLRDWPNLLNYTLLCPLYIGFGAVLISTTVRGWTELKALNLEHDQPHGHSTAYGRSFLLLLLILLTAFLLSVHYMTEIIDPSIYPRVHWFIDHVRTDGTRVLGALGAYYTLLNFALLLFSLFVIATFISLFRLVVDIANSMERLRARKQLSTEALRKRLTTFTQAYIAGKLVVAAYMINALTWKSSQVHQSANLIAMGGVLTFFGVVFLSIPRYYVELQWFRLRSREVTTSHETAEYEDLRPWEIDFVGGSWKPRLVANILDTIIISGFITSFWL